MWQTRMKGSLEQEYENYLEFADDGNGIDMTTGEPIKNFDEWVNS